MARGRSTGRRPDYQWDGTAFQFVTIAEANQITPMTTLGITGTYVRFRGNVLVAMDVGAADDGKI